MWVLSPGGRLGVGFCSMDPDEMIRRVNELKLSHDKNDLRIKLSNDLSHLGQERLSRCLLGKVFSPKAINRDVFRSQMPKLLQAQKHIDIEIVGENLFILEFISLSDRRRALLDGPWNFFKNLVLFKEPRGFQNPTGIVFDEISMWVQCHNLPIAFMHQSIIRKIGEQLGCVLDIDVGERGQCLGRFARIRIRRNLSIPLQQCIWVQPSDSEEDIPILLLYERLPEFCFSCGRVGHTFRDCEEDNSVNMSHKFGAWLRASFHSGSTRTRNGRGTREGSGQHNSPRNMTESEVGEPLGPPNSILGQESHHQTNPSNSLSQLVEPYQDVGVSDTGGDNMRMENMALYIPTPPDIHQEFGGKSIYDMSGKNEGLADATPLCPNTTPELSMIDTSSTNPKMKWKRRARGAGKTDGLLDDLTNLTTGTKRSFEEVPLEAKGQKKPKALSCGDDATNTKFFSLTVEAASQPRRDQ